MKEWTLAERYRVLEDKSQIEELYSRISRSDYRQDYHVQPITGLSSDPNGFIYHKGQWHLFYQWCPWGAVHGLKYWYHVLSKDLIHWENKGVGLAPDTFYDNKGVHSGSGFSYDNRLYLFYTGNHRDENWVRTPYTCAAKLSDSGQVSKLPQPLFGPHPDYTEHQRDPKVVYHEEKQRYYILLGAQSKEGKGKILIYTSKQLLAGWTFAGELKVPGYEDFGGMWECPSIAQLGDSDVLVFSPQYTKLPGRNANTNHTVYLIGRMDYDSLTFTAEGPYRCLDYGFDFYAAQFAANVQDKNKAVLTAWIGLPDNHYPTEEEEWEGSLCLPRELKICKGRLLQQPVEQVKELRQEKLQINQQQNLPRVCELEAVNKGTDFRLGLFTKSDGSGGLEIHYDAKNNLCLIDRSQMDQRFNQELGEELTLPLEAPLTYLSVFIDRCSVELFFNQGEATFTTHLYPTSQESFYTVSGELDLEIWTLKKAVKDSFIV
ncbi:glycoside hydrolase family 32 protein [Streptococcus sp. H49]|uniref:glycoside hydrolase family 32 protein n=1 Tax=Streptococcus huangxiaojuni TaxID=3237239 RepID=UPI0034A0F716